MIRRETVRLLKKCTACDSAFIYHWGFVINWFVTIRECVPYSIDDIIYPGITCDFLGFAMSLAGYRGSWFWIAGSNL
jgi:hypothetical protein